MNRDEFEEKLKLLVEAWCDRRELVPLRRILNGRAAINGLTDGWEALHDELRTIRAQNKDSLSENEVETVVELIHELDRMLKH